jgi:hypothetical protein
MTICCVESCERTPQKGSVCQMHVMRMRRHGNYTTVKPPLGRRLVGDAKPAYVTIHARLRRSKGKATNYGCTACGRQAETWAYQGGCPDEVRDPRTGSPYTADLSRYAPMCASCHKKFDYRQRSLSCT